MKFLDRIITAFLEPKVLLFIKKNSSDSFESIVLKKSPSEHISSLEIAVEIQSRKKIKQKLPTWFQNDKVIFFSLLSMEQCSSEITAQYKSSFISGSSLLDLSAGFGIDSFYFSKKFKQITSIESQTDLADINQYNAQILGQENIKVINIDAENYIQNCTEKFDIVYIDPARRSENNSKVFLMNECTPDIIKLLPQIKKITSKLLIKVSPMADITYLKNYFLDLIEIHIVSVHNECKELLLLLDFDQSINKEIKITAVNLYRHQENQVFQYQYNENFKVQNSHYQQYIYEPNASLMKSGNWGAIGNHFQLSKIASNTHLYTNDILCKNFHGSIFKVIESIDIKTNNLPQKLKSTKKANVITRNFPIKSEEVQKKLKLTSAESDFIICFKNQNDENISLWCEKLN